MQYIDAFIKPNTPTILGLTHPKLEDLKKLIISNDTK